MKHGHRSLAGALGVAALAAALALLAVGGQGALAQAGSIIYVDADAGGVNNGSSWRHAFTDLQSALEQAEAGDQIWVAEGTYKPARRIIDDDDRSATFQMVNGVAILGGFDPGTGAVKLEHRDWVANKTILSGNVGAEASPLDNVYHVFYHPEGLFLDSSAVLDGFVIADGNADQEDPSGLRGGGMLNEGSSPTLNNITFLNNSAGYGGGFWVSAPVPEEMTVALTNVNFVANSAVEGGSVYLDAAQADPGEAWEITFTNCIFQGNVVERGGAVLVALGELDADTPLIRFTNCTFSSNQAELGSAFYVGEGPGEGWLAVTNSIMWDDTADEIYVEDGVWPPLVTYSDVQGGYEGDTDIDENPSFVDPDVGDLHLQPDSPCIDVGDNDAPDIPMVDFEGDDRILDGDVFGEAVVDMGADEFKTPAIWVDIDVTPYVPSNVIKLGSPRRVPVAILSTDEFDAVTRVAPDTVEFAGAPHVGFTFVDVDNDDDEDVLLEFRARDMDELNEHSTEAILTGETQDGIPIEGTDEVKVIP